MMRWAASEHNGHLTWKLEEGIEVTQELVQDLLVIQGIDAHEELVDILQKELKEKGFEPMSEDEINVAKSFRFNPQDNADLVEWIRKGVSPFKEIRWKETDTTYQICNMSVGKEKLKFSTIFGMDAKDEMISIINAELEAAGDLKLTEKEKEFILEKKFE